MKGKQKMKGINQKGFGHHLMIAGVAVFVVAAGGFAGWRVYQSRQINARAANYLLASTKDYYITACKTYISGEGGSQQYRVTTYVNWTAKTASDGTKYKGVYVNWGGSVKTLNKMSGTLYSYGNLKNSNYTRSNNFEVGPVGANNALFRGVQRSYSNIKSC